MNNLEVLYELKQIKDLILGKPVSNEDQRQLRKERLYAKMDKAKLKHLRK